MANHALPNLTSTYTNYTSEFSTRINDVALGLDPATTTATNVPTNSVRWNSATNRWEKWSGTAWAALTATYAISISGSAATAATLTTARNINGVSFNGSANITVTANTSQAVTFNSSGSGVASGTAFNGSVARVVSYNTLGATAYGWSLASAASSTAARATLGAAAIETGEVYPVGCLVFAFQDNTPAAIAGYGQVNTGENLRPAGVFFGGGLFVRAAGIGVGTWRCLGMGGNSTGGGNGNTLAALWQRVS